jgi:Zn-dependent protease/CBS domain-containing protein
MHSPTQTITTPSHAPYAARRGWTIARPFGVHLVADFSLLFILVLITLNLAAGFLPYWHSDWPPWLHWTLAAAAALALFASVALHELAHALVARAQGMTVRRINLFVFGGVAEIEGRPPSPRAEFLIAVVGPLTSVALGVLCAWLGSSLAARGASSVVEDPEALLRDAGPLATLLIWLGPLNLILAAFNMIPGFPLDGGRVLRALVWWITHDLRKATAVAARVGQLFAWLLMGYGVFRMLGFAPLGMSGAPLQGLWLLMIGWFLNHAARSSYRQQLVQEALEDVAVGELMRSRVRTVSPALTVADLVRDFVLGAEEAAFPVVESDHALGIVGEAQVRTIPRERWASTRVDEIMTPIEQLHVLEPQDAALTAVRHLADHDPIPIVEGERFVGVARRSDILRWMSLQTSPV